MSDRRSLNTLCFCTARAVPTCQSRITAHSGKPSKVEFKCLARSRNINREGHRLTAGAGISVGASNTCTPPLPDRRGTHNIYKRRTPRKSSAWGERLVAALSLAPAVRQLGEIDDEAAFLGRDQIDRSYRGIGKPFHAFRQTALKLVYLRGKVVARAPHPDPLPASGAREYCAALQVQRRSRPCLPAACFTIPKLPQAYVIDAVCSVFRPCRQVGSSEIPQAD